MNEHTIELYVLKKIQKKEIQFMKGSDAVPIRFMFKDFGIPEGATASYFIQKPSGAQVHDNCTIDRNTNSVVIQTNKQMVAEEGLMYIQLHLSIGDKDLITFGQPYIVNGSETPIDSETYMPVIDLCVVNANKAIKHCNDVTAYAEEVARTIKATADTGGYTATIRVGDVVAADHTEAPLVVNRGSNQDAILDFVIPRGLPGSEVPIINNLTQSTAGVYALDAAQGKVLKNEIDAEKQKTATNTQEIASIKTGYTQAQSQIKILTPGTTEPTLSMIESGKTCVYFQIVEG